MDKMSHRKIRDKDPFSSNSEKNSEKLKNGHCRMCQNFDFHCSDCRKRCHKKCQGHSHGCSKSSKLRRTSSASSRLLPDEMHWTKKLQANEFEPVRPCNQHCIRRYPRLLYSPPRQPSTTPLLSSSLNHSHPSSIKPSPLQTPASIPCVSVVPPEPLNAQGQLNSMEKSEKSVIHTLFTKFIDWIESSKQNADEKTDKMTNSGKPKRPNTLQINEANSGKNLISSSSPSSVRSITEGCSSSCGSDWVSSREGAYSFHVDESPSKSNRFFHWLHKTASSSESEGTSVFGSGFPSPQSENESSLYSQKISTHKFSKWTNKSRRSSRVSSSCSSQTAATSCTSPAFSECGRRLPHASANLPLKTQLDIQETAIELEIWEAKRRNVRASSLISNQESNLESNPLNELMNDVRRLSKKRALLSKNASKESTDTHVADLNDIVITTEEVTTSKDSVLSSESYLVETLLEWNIEYSDIKIKERIREGVRYNIYRGRWHGDVLVNLFHENDANCIEWFLEEVTKLAKIRHENICLFMGASFNRDNLAIVTSDLKGISVYERLHLGQERLPSRMRVLIARQVALAVGYLHAKGMSVVALNSRNVYFEPKVKLSLVDQAVTEFCRPYHLCFPRGIVTYLAPEVLKQLKISKTNTFRHPKELMTFHVDSFAFGTLLYELMSGQLPFKSLSASEIIFRLASGGRETVKHLNCNNFLKVLTTRCWSHNPQSRPHFNEINKDLLLKTGLHKRHSCSQPDQLNIHPHHLRHQQPAGFNLQNYNKQISLN